MVVIIGSVWTTDTGLKYPALISDTDQEEIWFVEVDWLNASIRESIIDNYKIPGWIYYRRKEQLPALVTLLNASQLHTWIKWFLPLRSNLINSTGLRPKDRLRQNDTSREIDRGRLLFLWLWTSQFIFMNIYEQEINTTKSIISGVEVRRRQRKYYKNHFRATTHPEDLAPHGQNIFQ